MALLLILLALLGFGLASFGGSRGSRSSTTVTFQATTVATAQAKCSKHEHAEPASSRCRPPASP
ncbi:MAG: hypothetical protein E6F97_07280 [Actinobacteria bacterium]|nr:MAG: hypothetical protein E6F97_07280 [Actinomycetota bacterium]